MKENFSICVSLNEPTQVLCSPLRYACAKETQNNIAKALELNYRIDLHPDPRLAPSGTHMGWDPNTNIDFKN